jgi:hypothetical protein
MFAYHTISPAYYGYGRFGQVAEVLGSITQAALTVYQADAQRRAIKQARHDAERQRAHELEMARQAAAAQQAAAQQAATMAVATGGATSAMQQAGGGGMTTGTKVGLGVGAAALVGGALLLRR